MCWAADGPARPSRRCYRPTVLPCVSDGSQPSAFSWSVSLSRWPSCWRSRPARKEPTATTRRRPPLPPGTTRRRLALGLCLVLAAFGLIPAATAVPWRSPFLTAGVGSVAAGSGLAGALRSLPGTDRPHGGSRGLGKPHLTVRWRDQGALWRGGRPRRSGSSPIFVAWTRDVPRALCALGLVALLYPLGTALSLVTGDTAGALWVLGIASSSECRRGSWRRAPSWR